MSSSFSVENSLKQGNVSPLLFNFTVEYTIRKIQETNLGLDMNDTRQVWTYANDENLIGDDISATGRNANMLLYACKNVGFSSKHSEN